MGCAGPRLEAVASPAEPALTLDQSGIRLTISPNNWARYPSNFSWYYTQVGIQVEFDVDALARWVHSPIPLDGRMPPLLGFNCRNRPPPEREGWLGVRISWRLPAGFSSLHQLA